MSTYIIIQARTGSTRLPNKMLMPFADGKGILEILLDRIKGAFPPGFDKLVVATTTQPGDDRIAALCRRMGVSCFRGSEDDVLQRFIGAAERFGATRIIRVCADNVFLDVDQLAALYKRLEASGNDYEAYRTADGTPSIKTHYGFWAEGTTLDALKRVRALTDEKLYHEHVTNYIYTHPELFKVALTPLAEVAPGIEEARGLRLTIDTAEDFDISREVYAHLVGQGIATSPANIITYLAQRPDLYERMTAVIKQNSK